MLFRLCLQQANAIQALRRALAAQTRINAVLSRELEQTRRDADLLALCARDRDTALALIRDSRRIAHLEET